MFADVPYDGDESLKPKSWIGVAVARLKVYDRTSAAENRDAGKDRDVVQVYVSPRKDMRLVAHVRLSAPRVGSGIIFTGIERHDDFHKLSVYHREGR